MKNISTLYKLYGVSSIFILSFNAFAQGELKIYNWSDYIAEDTIENFEKETGIDVSYDVFDSNEILEAKLLAGNSGYDLVVPTSGFMGKQVKARIHQPIDKNNIPNYKNLDTDLLEKLSELDPGNEYAVPYMWGTTGIGYNMDMIKERMPNAPVDSWDLIFNPDIASNFKDCGIAVFDSPSEMFPIALNYLGLDPESEKQEDINKARDMLVKMAKNVRYFHSSQPVNDLANGEICITTGFNGDILQARERAAEADNGVNIQYFIPKEGTEIWFDVFVIPATAENKKNAEIFINFILKPEISADITNYVWYANGNKESFDLIDEGITSDESIYPSQEVIDTSFTSGVHGNRYDRMISRAWTYVKSGQ